MLTDLAIDATGASLFVSDGEGNIVRKIELKTA